MTYSSAKFPGDLAADVLGPRRGAWQWRILSLAVAAAAVLLVMFWPSRLAEQSQVSPIASHNAVNVSADTNVADAASDQSSDDQDVLRNSFAAVPSLPEIGPLFWTSDATTAVVPSFPSIEELTSAERTETDSTLSEDYR